VAAPLPSAPSVLAFDGGSTKTDVVLVSRLGGVLGRARVGPSNHQLVGLDGTISALTEALSAVMADAGMSGAPAPICPTGVYCLAGLDLPVDEEKLAPAIEALGWTDTVILRNDTFAVSRAGTTSPWGIGVVCGTGMNCAAIGPDGRTVRFPALAELSGDFAPGGAWLGLRALGLALRAGDGRGPATMLRERVAAQLGTVDPEAALTGIYSGTLPYARLFELARVLLDAAADGDAPARAAADMLADEVVAFVRAAVLRLDLQDEAVEVVLGGGIFDTTDAAFHARIAAGINAVAPRARLVRLHAPPVLGAALIGLDAEGVPPPALATLRAALTLPEDAPAGQP
jgi:N-acetylglucosamine kinase-like BadF-type ATPase